MKKIINLILTIMMVFGFVFKVEAATTGSITIKKSATTNDVTYNVYKLLDMTYDETNKSAAYTINADWKTFFEQEEVKALITTTTALDGTIYVTKVNSTAAAKTLAEKAIAYAKTNKIASTKSATIKAKETETTISGLELGYYLVDSTLGALVHLDSTTTSATINEKNGEPTIVKEVTETTTGIGKILHYTITVDVKAGANNYKITDVLSKGLTLDTTSFTYTYTGTYTGGNPTPSVTADSTSKETTFVIDYTDKDLTNTTKIVIKYSATVNTDALMLTEVENDAKLEYGNGNTIKYDPVKTPLGQITLVKTDEDDTQLEGATFKLYKNNVEVKLIKDGDYYRPVVGDETAELITIGKTTIRGLEVGDYELEEITPPEGYTRLAARVKISVTKEGNTSSPRAIINTTGAVLTPTGGMGTTLFVTIGSLIILVCGIVLVTKFRMTRI